ncbi:MAG: hypothetical protein H7A47_10075 [Verrucomicrobiales bacterium]|nr:hypothetical protein [Verrucomicrobiales bacterium]
MKPALLFSLVASCVTAGALIGADAPSKPDVTGTWVWTMEGRDGQTRERSITLKQEGTKLTGSMPGRQEGQSTPISEGRVEGDQVMFKVVRETQRGNFTSEYKGKIDGETIKGAMSATMGDRTLEREWVVKRKPAEVVGKWKWSMSRDDGQSWEADLVIKREDGKLVGEMGREGADWKVEMTEIQVKGNLLTYQTVMSRDGNEVTIKSRAMVEGDTMKGKSEGTRNGEAWTREWKAVRQKQ